MTQDQRIGLTAGDFSAEVAPQHGGRLSVLRWKGPQGVVDLIPPLGPWRSEPRGWPKEGAYPLFPYSNRIRDAVLHHDGRTFPLRAHPASLPHSVHGTAHLLPWRVEQAGESQSSIVLDYVPDSDWPFAFQARQIFKLSSSGLTVDLSIRNDADEPAPAGMGWHPYFLCKTGSRFDHDAKRHWNIGPGYITDGTSGPYRGEKADNLYLSEWRRAALVHPDGSGIAITADATLGHLVLHRPAVGAYACIEPVSHVTDGFNLAGAGVEGTGLVVLAPGEVLSGQVRLTLLPEG